MKYKDVRYPLLKSEAEIVADIYHSLRMNGFDARVEVSPWAGGDRVDIGVFRDGDLWFCVEVKKWIRPAKVRSHTGPYYAEMEPTGVQVRALRMQIERYRATFRCDVLSVCGEKEAIEFIAAIENAEGCRPSWRFGCRFTGKGVDG